MPPILGVIGRSVTSTHRPTPSSACCPGLQRPRRRCRGWVPFAAFEPGFLTQRFAHGYFLVAPRQRRIRCTGDRSGELRSAATSRANTAVPAAARGARRQRRCTTRGSKAICGSSRSCCSARSAAAAADRVRQPDEPADREGDRPPPRGRGAVSRSARAAARSSGSSSSKACSWQPSARPRGCSSPSCCLARPPRCCRTPTHFSA